MIRIHREKLEKKKPNVISQEGLLDDYFRTFGYSFVEIHRYEELKYYFKYEGDLNSYFSLWVLGVYSLTGEKDATNDETYTETFVYYKSFQLENNFGVAVQRIGFQCNVGSIKRIDDPILNSIFEKKDLKFRKMMTVGHYTKMKTVLEHILPVDPVSPENKNRLLINTFKNSNDPWEYRQNCYTIFDISKFYSDPIDQYHKAPEMQKEFFTRVGFISFTKDTDLVKNFDHPGMWAHYGENHKGICLIFDLIELGDLFKNQFKNITVSGSMKYGAIENKPIHLENEISLEALFKEHAKDLFFEKMKDWGNEKEFRFVTFDNTPDCDKNSYLQYIDDALIAIILGANFDNTYKCVINQYLTNRDNNNKNKIEFYQMVFDNGIFRVSDFQSGLPSRCNDILNDFIIEQ